MVLGISQTMLAQSVTVNADITTNTTWTNDNIYLLQGGFIYVTNNATLTIEPGTLIKSDASALVITRGAKIMASGTSSRPIVFTSSQPAGSRAAGDWGGILIFGKAPINDPAGQRLGEGGIDPVKGLYGGTDANDNSGMFQYVRIEFAGIAYQPNNETNGLTCGGVGLATTIDHVQVSYGGDDSFEFFGGTVNAKYLVANRGLDDEFDTDYGFSGRLQFCVSLRDSSLADVSGSNGFESDNDATGTTNAPLTHPIISNLTIVGPKRALTTTVNSNYKRAAHLRRSTSECVYNSLLMGYPTGIKIEGQTTANNANAGSLQWKNNLVAGCPIALDSTGLTGFNMLNWFNSNGNGLLTNVSDLMLTNAYNFMAPNFQPMNGSPALSGADFSAPNLNNSFFEQTTYRGAFDGTNDWTACWTNWDPQNTPYNTAGIDYMPLAVVASGPTTFCSGGSVDIVATSTGTNYLWSNGATTSTVSATQSGNYTVTVSNNSGCSNVSVPITVTVNPTPVADFFNTGIFPTIAFNNLVFNADSSFWDFGDGNTSTTMHPIHNYTTQGNFNVCLTAWVGSCSNTICKGVSVTTSIADGLQAQVRLFPNPATASTQVEVSTETAAEGTVAIYNLAGQLLQEMPVALNAGTNRYTVALHTLPAGMYMVRVRVAEATKSLPLVIVR
jgi:Secretion system C-terminal sorting domain/PKD domain